MSLIGLLTATEKQVHLGQLHMRPIQWHLKNNWRVPKSLEKVTPIPRSVHPMVGRRQCTHRPTITANETCSVNIYRHIKRRVGHSLRRAHLGKQAAYKLSRTKSSPSGFKRVPRPLLKQDDTCSNQQHHSSVIHKQGRRHEVRPTLCPTTENLDLVYQETSDSKLDTFQAD